MKIFFERFIALIIMSIICIFVSFFLSKIAYTEDYIIKYYRQGVVTIEYDDIIHAIGKGEKEKIQEENHPDQDDESQRNESMTDFKKAQKAEKDGYWNRAIYYYEQAGEEEKAIEMAYKSIERELAKNPPNYFGASLSALDPLRDKELTMEYYEKYILRYLGEIE